MPFFFDVFYVVLYAIIAAAAIGLIVVNWIHWQTDRARARQIPPSAPCPLKNTPFVSLLVPAWNEVHNLPNHIASFQALPYPNKELILCVGGNDNSFEIAKRHESNRIRILEQRGGEGKQSALRRSLELAAGDIIFLTDADCLLNNCAFTCTLAPLINEGEAASTGRYAPLPQQRNNLLVVNQWYIDNYARSYSPSYVEGIIGRNAAVTRSVLEQVGAFNEPVKIGTDYFLAQKLRCAGIRVRYVNISSVETEYKDHVLPYLRQQSRWLRNILLHGRNFGARHQVQSTFTQCIIGLGIISFPLTFPITKGVGIGLWFVVLLYGTLSRWRYFRYGEITLQQPHRLTIYLLAPFYFLLDQLMLAYTILDWLLPNRRWKW